MKHDILLIIIYDNLMTMSDDVYEKLTDGSVTNNRDFTVYAYFFSTFINAFLLLIFQSMVLDLDFLK